VVLSVMLSDSSCGAGFGSINWSRFPFTTFSGSVSMLCFCGSLVLIFKPPEK